MKFRIDFNRETDDVVLEEMGAKLVTIPHATKYGPFERYEIELSSFEDLEMLLQKVDSIKKRRLFCYNILWTASNLFR